MSEVIDSYRLGNIQVSITPTENPEKYDVSCNDGNFRSEFTIRKYEYENYKRHMNQRIKDAYNKQYEEDPGSDTED
jgi:hypothetical protein